MQPRRIRNFPVWGRKSYWEVERMHVDGPNCGIMIKGLDWLERHSPQTLRYGKHGAINILVFPYLNGKVASSECSPVKT